MDTQKLKEKLDAFLIERGEIKKGYPEILPKISDPDRLRELWRKASPESEPKRLIEERMEEVYRNISDPDRLMELWENFSLGSVPKRLIEERMKDLVLSID